MFSDPKGSITIAAACSIVIALIGLIAVWVQMPFLFASLGPTLAIQTTTPLAPSAHPWNVGVSHLIGLGIGVLAVYVTGAVHAPPFLHANPLSLDRVAAAVFGVGIGMLIEFLLHASHPPAAATSLLVTLGGVDITWRGVGSILAGIALVTLFGEAARRLRVRQS